MRVFESEQDRMDFLTNQGKYLKQHLKELAEEVKRTGKPRIERGYGDKRHGAVRTGVNTPYND